MKYMCRYRWLSQPLLWWMSIAYRMSGCLFMRSNNCRLFWTWSQRNTTRHSTLYNWIVNITLSLINYMSIANLITPMELWITNKINYLFRLLNDNELTRIKSDGLFGRLPNLVKLDLRRNKINSIEQNAFEGASKINDLLLAENKLDKIHNKMFLGLHNLKMLYVSNLSYDTLILSCLLKSPISIHVSLLQFIIWQCHHLCYAWIVWLSDQTANIAFGIESIQLQLPFGMVFGLVAQAYVEWIAGYLCQH